MIDQKTIDEARRRLTYQFGSQLCPADIDDVIQDAVLYTLERAPEKANLYFLKRVKFQAVTAVQDPEARRARQAEYQRAWYRANRERSYARVNAWKRANAERAREISRESARRIAKDHPERIRAKTKRRWERLKADPERYEAYKAARREYRLEYQRAYRAARKKAEAA